MKRLTLSTVSTVFLLAFVSGCSGSDVSTLSAATAAEPGAIDPGRSERLVAELDASEETSLQHGIQRWEVRDTAQGLITRGVGPDDVSIVEFAVRMNQTEANDDIILDALAPGGGSATLRDGTVISADTAALGEQALALFQDASLQPALLQETPENEAESKAKASTTGTLRSALSAGVYNVDTYEVAYEGGCKARTQAALDVGSVASDLAMTTTVRSPYLFAGCMARIQARFPSSFGISFSGPSYLAGACAVLDPSCASFRQTGPLHFPDPVPLALMQFISGLQVEQSRG